MSTDKIIKALFASINKLEEQHQCWLDAQAELKRLKSALKDIVEANGCRECGGELQSEMAKKALGISEEAK